MEPRGNDKSADSKQICNHDDLQSFGGWLRERRLVRQDLVRYMIGWVGRFRRLQAQRPAETWRDTLEAFLEDLGNGRTEPWQLRQAATAITLYCDQFCAGNRAGGVPTGNSSARPRVPELDEWEQFPSEMRRLMELRHYAPRTVRSYLGWAERFLRYARRACGGQLSPETAKTYLSYLATRRNVAASTQNQAFSALLFLFRNVLEIDIGDRGGRGKSPFGAAAVPDARIRRCALSPNPSIRLSRAPCLRASGPASHPKRLSPRPPRKHGAGQAWPEAARCAVAGGDEGGTSRGTRGRAHHAGADLRRRAQGQRVGNTAR